MPMKVRVGNKLKFFTRHMFGVVVNGTVKRVTREYVVVNVVAAGAVWDEKIYYGTEVDINGWYPLEKPG